MLCDIKISITFSSPNGKKICFFYPSEEIDSYFKENKNFRKIITFTKDDVL